MARFEIFQDPRGDFRWRLVNPDDSKIAVSEGYDSRELAHLSAEKTRLWSRVEGVEIIDD